jgi:hypothetical protein
MKIHSFQLTRTNQRIRAEATVQWEDCRRADHKLFFEIDADNANTLNLNPHAFLVAAAVPAQHYGERRVSIDGEICPELKANLEEALAVIRFWYYRNQNRAPLKIEARAARRAPAAPPRNRSGFFFSGGIDSFATLRANHLQNKPGDAMFITDGILVFGLEQDNPALFQHVVSSLSGVSKDSGIHFIPVYTNVYLVYRREDAEIRYHFWGFEFGGCALAAVAHAFSGYLANMSIASTCGLVNLSPWGSHPVLDPLYSSCDMRIRHDGITLTRLEKTRLVAKWDTALGHLRVCNCFKKYTQYQLNCCRCEKCVRTMLTLAALDKLGSTPSFPAQLNPDLVRKAAIIDNDYTCFCYEELIPGLKALGRNELVKAICYCLNRYQRTYKKSLFRFRLFKKNKSTQIPNTIKKSLNYAKSTNYQANVTT